MVKRIRWLIGYMILLGGISALQAGESTFPLDQLPKKSETASLQRGAQLYVNYCLGCHSLRSVRLSGLNALKLTDEQIRENLLLNEVSISETMTIAFSAENARNAFGIAPPDLSLITRARSSHFGSGSDWVYTYLRRFYRDRSQPFGWNNELAPSTLMPHVLYALDPVNWEATPVGQSDATDTLTLTPLEYEETLAEIVHFLAYVAEPNKKARQTVGIYALLFLFVLFVLTYAVKVEFWKTIQSTDDRIS